MNTTLIVFVVLYLLGTLSLGVWAGTRIKNTSDFAIAGRSLPLIMVVTTTFATWFGAETVMGIPAKFVQGGLNAIIEDPFVTKILLQDMEREWRALQARYDRFTEFYAMVQRDLKAS